MPPIRSRRLAAARGIPISFTAQMRYRRALNPRRGGLDGRLGNRGSEGRRRAAQLHSCRWRKSRIPTITSRRRACRRATHRRKPTRSRSSTRAPVNDRLSLDREGFVLLHRPTAATNLYDDDEITSRLLPRMRAGDQGGDRRRAGRRLRPYRAQRRPRRRKGNQIKLPASRVHNDYTAWSAPQRVRDLMGDEAEELLKHRFAEINLWRPIRGPLLRSPLALCDAQTLAEENLVASDLRYPDRTGETYAITYNPAQRWYLFPEDAGRRSRADPLLRLRRARARRGFPRTAPSTTRNRPTRRPAAREHRGAHPGVLRRLTQVVGWAGPRYSVKPGSWLAAQ